MQSSVAHRLTLYAPRSVDPAEATVLTPRAGSIHADPFQVASIQGVAGFQPYLEVNPQGRDSQLDPLNKRLDTGRRVWRIIDKRTGNDNLSRWLTPFLGDAAGSNQLLGLKAIAEQSLDGGATWQRFATDRVFGQHSSSGSIVWFELECRTMADMLERDVFVSAPHATVAGYARLSQVAPIGLMKAYGDFPIITAIKGKISSVAAVGAKSFSITVDRTQTDPRKCTYTAALLRIPRATTPGSEAFGRVWVSTDGGVNYTAYDYQGSTNYPVTQSQYGPVLGAPGINSLTLVNARKLAVDPPALNTDVVFYIESLVEGVSTEVPLLINDVHPATLLKHLCLGYFGRLDAAGAVTWAMSIDAASFATIEADATIPNVRFLVTTRSKLRVWIEENILKANHLSIRLDEYGAVVLVDHRRSSVFAPAWTLVNNDLIAAKDAVQWTQDRDNAIAAVIGKYYAERQITDAELPDPFSAVPDARVKDGKYVQVANTMNFPAIPSVRFVQVDDAFLVRRQSFSSRALDIGGSEFTFDAKGLRFRLGAQTSDSEKLNGRPKQEVLTGYLASLAGELQGPFGMGPTYYTLRVLKSSANVAAVKVGTTGVLDLDAIPDPATGLRGGPRVALCIGSTARGPEVQLRMLDWGANAVAVVPVLAAPALSADQPTNALTQGVTLNGSGQQVRIDVNVTSTAVGARPAATDAGWKQAAVTTATATVVIAGLAAAGKRVWTRARTEPAPGQGFGLPSDWAFPGSGTGYIDLTALAPPTAPDATSLAGDQIDFVWTVGDATLPLEVFMLAGAVAPTGLETERVGAQLLPGSTNLSIVGKTIAATQYTTGVRHFDQFGNVSTMASDTIVAGASVGLPAPTYPDGFSFLFAPQYGLVVIAGVLPSRIEFQEAVETAPGSGLYGAYSTVAILDAVAGDWTKWTGVAPLDSKRRKLKARSIRDGATASAYTADVIVRPWLVADPILKYPITAPSATATPVIASRTRTDETIQFVYAIGQNDIGPASWRYKVDDGAYSAPATTASPQSVVVTRAKFYTKHVTLEVTQADGQTKTAVCTVLSELTALDDTSGKKRRAIANDDGDYDLVSTVNDGKTAHSGVKESGGKPVNRLLAKTLAGDVDTLDGLPEGTSYKRVIATAIDAATNYIDFAGAGWKNTKNSANLPRSAADATAVSTIVQHVANTGHAASTMQESGGKPINRLLAKTLAGDVDHLDGVPEGTTYKRTTVNEKTGAGRGYTALDSSNILVTGVDRAATIGTTERAISVTKRTGIFFNETFEATLQTQAWALVVWNGEALVSTAGVATAGKNVNRVTGAILAEFPYNLPFNPTKLYRLRCRIRQVTDTSDNFAYIGLKCFDSTDTVTNFDSGYAWVLVTGHALTVAEGWLEFTTYVKGATLGYGSGPGVSTNPAAPTALNTNTVSIRPALAFNNGDGSGPGVSDIDYYTIEELDENVSSRSEQVAFGATTKFPVLRHTENDNGVSGDTKTFTTSYDAVPEVLITGKVWTLPGASSTVDRKIEMKEINLTVSTYEIRAKWSTGSSSSAQTENPADTLNGTPANPKTITATGTARYWNLANANTTLATYTVNFDVDTSTATGPGLLQVKIYKNDGTSSTSWTQVASRQYDWGATFNGEQLSFDAAMAADWDIRIVATWPGGSGWIGTVVTVKTCTYDKITAGTENVLTPAGSVVFGAAKEKS